MATDGAESIGAVYVKVKRTNCVLLVVDVQDRLIGTIAEHRAMVQNIRALIRAAKVLNVPIIGTEQEKLGGLVPELQDLLSEWPRFRKLSFSCYGIAAFVRQLQQLHKKIVIICGIETHICVLQTVLDMLGARYRVLLARDATSSHATIDRETAIEEMRDAGAAIGTTEGIIYQLTERAGTEEFGKVLEIVKERRNALSSAS